MKIILFLIFIPTFIFSQKIEKVQEVDTIFYINKILDGKIYDIELKSQILNEIRSITIYEPPKYNKNISYGVLFVTDGICKTISGDIENLINNKIIEPIIIVGINHREIQKIDSVFGSVKIDFRRLEYLKGDKKYDGVFKDINAIKLIEERYEKFSKFLSNEVIEYVKSHYTIKKDIKYWTLGGYSNGGSFVLSFSCDFPDIFGNTIIMSPGFNDRDNKSDISKSTSSYFICAGINEPSFLKPSIEFLPRLNENNLSFVHKTYNSGHDWKMWWTFYIDSIKFIFGT
jgi:enterochelin esterase-like enzyme